MRIVKPCKPYDGAANPRHAVIVQAGIDGPPMINLVPMIERLRLDDPSFWR